MDAKKLPKISLEIVAWIVLGAAFVLSCSLLLFGNENLRFSWPDEMSNHYFIEQFAQSGSFAVSEPLSELSNGLVTPRSTFLLEGELVPIGFLGLPILYGAIAALIGVYGTLLMTPVLGVIGVYFFYLLIRRVFSVPVASLSAILLLTQPAYWYYSHFLLLPNIPFIALLIISVYLLYFAGAGRGRYGYYIISSLTAGSAFMIRPSEFIWIGVLYLVVLISVRKNLTIASVLMFFLPATLIVLIYFYFNFETYGSFLPLGYISTAGAETTSALAGEGGVLKRIGQIIFPFGVRPSVILSNFNNFILPLHWPYLIAIITGAIVAAIFDKQRHIRVYLILAATISLYQTVYYGSWGLVDEFTLKISTIGVSINRYLLPAIAFLIPFAAYALVQIAEHVKPYGRRLASLLTAVLIIFSALQVYLANNDSILNVREGILVSNSIHDSVISMTEEDAVIITERGDKLVFPQRKVISQYDPANLSGVSALATEIPVYYLIYKDELKIRILNEEFFSVQGLSIENPRYLPGEFILYEVGITQ